MDGSQAYTYKKIKKRTNTARTLIWDAYRSQLGGQH